MGNLSRAGGTAREDASGSEAAVFLMKQGKPVWPFATASNDRCQNLFHVWGSFKPFAFHVWIDLKHMIWGILGCSHV